MTIGLGIDTSFDDTAVALLRDGRRILANARVSQFREHEEFGGVIPERASRLHMEAIHPLLSTVLDESGVALDDITFVAASDRPGLIGSLLVGVTVAKALALARNIPYVGLNHLEAHVHSIFLENEDIDYPFVSLIISGANTLLMHHTGLGRFEVLGGTTDDAVGECIDKSGRFLGLDMPAGPRLEQLALKGNPQAVELPRPMVGRPGLDFSFSGLKTAVIYRLRDDPSIRREDMAAALLRTIGEVLAIKATRAVKSTGTSTLVVCGGAAANLQIREALRTRAEKKGFRVAWPSKALCTDNAAMVAALGHDRLAAYGSTPLDAPVRATVSWKAEASG